jgi:hypothetical protein
MDSHDRAVSVWYRTAGLVSRGRKDLAIEIIAAEIRSAQYEVLLDADRLVRASADVERAAKALRERAEGIIRLRPAVKRP